LLTVLVLASSGNADVADRSLELNQGVSLVVSVHRASLAVGAEVQVAADSALVAGTTNVVGVGLALAAERAITADANMDGRRSSDPNVSELLIDWHKSVAVVSDLGRQHASGAEVPVRAVQALVADTRNVLVTAITDSVVEVVAARLHLGSDVVRHLGVLDSRDKTVLGMVTMSVLGEACLAQVKVFTDSAVEELDLGEF
jgi:hypothetical protein